MLAFLQFKEMKKTMIEKNIFSTILKSEVDDANAPKDELKKYYYICENIDEKGINKQYCNQIEEKM